MSATRIATIFRVSLMAFNYHDARPLEARFGRRQARLSQIERPGLPDEVMAERMVRRFVDKLKPGRLIDAPRGHQDVVGPQGELPVAKPARPGDAGANQRAPDAGPAGAWLDIEQPGLGHGGE